MDMILALFLLQFASGLCMNLVSMDNFIRNTTLPETTRDPTGKLSRQELINNNEQPTRARRIFKVVPVKANQRWNKKFSVQPELHGMSQDVPLAIIVAAKTDLRNLKINNESTINKTESTVENDSNITSNPYEDNGIENHFLSNLGQSIIGNFQNIFTKTVPNIVDDLKEVSYETKDTKEANRMNKENENEDSKEKTVENAPDLQTLGREHLENEDEESFVKSVTNEHLSNITETNLLKPKCRTDHNEFDIHKYLKKLHQDPLKRNFNIFFILKN